MKVWCGDLLLCYLTHLCNLCPRSDLCVPNFREVCEGNGLAYCQLLRQNLVDQMFFSRIANIHVTCLGILLDKRGVHSTDFVRNCWSRHDLFDIDLPSSV